MRWTFALALGLLLGAPAAARTAPYVLQPGHIDLAMGPDGNTVILDTAHGLVVVDTGRHPEHAQAIVDHARQVGKPVIALINTHWHLDHTTGNRDLLAIWPKAQLIATEAVSSALDGFLKQSRAQSEKALTDPALSSAARARIARSHQAMDDRRALIPLHPIVASEQRRLGGRQIDLHVARTAATEADLWLVIPSERLAVVGDLVVGPVPFFDTGCEEGWRAALAAIDRADWDTLVPGHGAPMTRADFGRWKSAFNRWLDCAGSDAAATVCVDGWMADAAGFYTAAEENGVRMMARYYVDEVLRAPAAQRMVYCRR